MARLGIIAGGGTLPRRLAECARARGDEVYILALHGQADAAAVEGFPHGWTRLGATQDAIDRLKTAGVDSVVLAGAVRRPTLAELRPDLRTLGIFARAGLAGLGDDALLRLVRAELEKDGFRVVGAHSIDPSLLTPEGVQTKRTPDEAELGDIAYGIRAARMLGELDAGQACVVQQGIVLGLEAVEGTDALLTRCGKLKRKGRGGVLVKMKKPQQDRDLDLPAVGPRTVRKAAEAGLQGIAMEAGETLFLEREETVALADKLGLFIVGVR